MIEEDLRAIQPPKFVPRITDNEHGKRVCPNLLLNQPKPTKPNKVAPDITAAAAAYIPLKNGQWAYLCAWMDLFTRVIVSWSVDDNMQESLVREPLEKALLRRKYSLN